MKTDIVNGAGYFLHPSPKLRELFRAKPYQGADPSQARFLFFGLDANFHKDIDQAGCFSHVCDYLADGVTFWKHHRVHHPFLLEDYHGDGLRYHRQFRRIGFVPEQAAEVSFVELVDLPTHDVSQLRVSDLRPEHMDRLADWVLNGAARYAFIPPRALELLRRVPQFSWLSSGDGSEAHGPLPVVCSSDRLTIYRPFHFSCVGRHCPQKVIDQQLIEIGKLAQTTPR